MLDVIPWSCFERQRAQEWSVRSETEDRTRIWEAIVPGSVFMIPNGSLSLTDAAAIALQSLPENMKIVKKCVCLCVGNPGSLRVSFLAVFLSTESTEFQSMNRLMSR